MLAAVRKYLNYLAVDWWSTQPPSRTAATCDADGGRSINRNEGYLIGSNLWCEECYNRTAEEMIIKDPDCIGYGTIEKAMAMFNTRGKHE